MERRSIILVFLSVLLLCFASNACGSDYEPAREYYADPGAADHGVAGSRTITSILTSVGTSTYATIVLPRLRIGTTTVYRIGRDVDWSAYTKITLKPMPGAILSHGAYTINWGGKLDVLPGQQVFNGTGVVTLADKEIYPDLFGADNSGSVESIAAINKAIASLPANGVLKLAGIYKVKPVSTTTFITLKSNMELSGNGTIKIADDTGNFDVLIGQSGAVANIKIKDITIDMNPTGNTSATVSTAVGSKQRAILFTDANNIEVSGVRFNPYVGVWAVIVTGTNCKNIRVTNNHFYFLPIVAKANYDNTAVYVEADTYVISDNVFYSAMASYARSAIELHDHNGVATGNTIKGFQTGVHVVGPNDAGTVEQITGHVVSGNTIMQAMNGVLIWPSVTAPTTTMSGIVVSDNTIDILSADWFAIHGSSTAQTRGIGTVLLDTVGACDISDLIITGNTITFKKENRLVEEGYLSAGIFLINKEKNISNFSVAGNIIKNAPGNGIMLNIGSIGGDVSNGRVDGNIIIDAGQNSSLLWPAYRNAIAGARKLSNVAIENNTIVDTGEVALNGVYSINLSHTTTTASNVRVRNNPVYTASGLAMLNSVEAAGIYGDMVVSALPDTYIPALNLGNCFTRTLTADTTVAAPATSHQAVIGDRITFIFTQHASSAKTVAFNAVYKIGSWVMTTAPEGKSMIDFVYDGTNWVGGVHQ